MATAFNGLRTGTWLSVLGMALLLGGLLQCGHGVYIYAKACLAQQLLKSAWEKTRSSGTSVKPWPWADMAPLARLTAPAYGIDLLVLEGSSGRSLAFGPGHVTGTALPGARGNSVISAHRDTHFTFLRRVHAGDDLWVETARGELYRYRVVSTGVTTENDTGVLLDSTETIMTLVTCYPFDAITAGGPLRYVVTAELVPPDART